MLIKKNSKNIKNSANIPKVMELWKCIIQKPKLFFTVFLKVVGKFYFQNLQETWYIKTAVPERIMLLSLFHKIEFH